MRRAAAALAMAVVAAVLFTFRATYDPDLFWHLAQGREVLAGRLVHTNLLSATATDLPQHYTSWGFEAALAVVAGPAGDASWIRVQLFQCVLIAAALLMLYASARVRSSRSAALAVLALSLFVIEPRVMPRPYLASWIGLAACAYWIERCLAWPLPRMLRPADILPLLGVTLVWTNLHSEVVFGVAFVGMIGLTEFLYPATVSRRRAAQIALVAAFAVVMTTGSPYGAGLWRYLAENARVPGVLRIAELQPPTPETYPAFFAYLAVLVALLVAFPRRLRPWEVVVTLAFAALGLRYIRLMPMLVFATAPIVASRIDALTARGWDRRAVAATVMAVVVVTAPASPARMLRAWRVGATAMVPPELYSADAIAFARARGLRGPLFNSMNLGGYIAWAMPEARVFQDSRLQAYPAEHFARILDASASPEKWRALVTPVNWAMVSLARPNELSGVGKFSPDEWTSVFRDRAVEVLVRK
jgi:hypothetical protein